MSVKCKICGDDDLTNIIVKNKIYYRCSNCFFIFLDKKYIVNEERERNRYLLHNNSMNDAGYVKIFEDFLNKFVVPYKNSSNNLLDFGSGPEPVLSQIASNFGYKVDIYDKYFYPDFSYKKKKYDIITCTEVIEHLVNPMTVFDEIHNLLNNNGIISGMTLFHENNDELFKRWWYIQDITHISFYSKKTIKYVASKLKLKLLNIDNKNKFVLKK